MKNLLLTTVAASTLLLSSAASAQQAEQEASSFIADQVATISVELFNATKASVVESLDAWSEELFSDDESATESTTAVDVVPSAEKQSQ